MCEYHASKGPQTATLMCRLSTLLSRGLPTTIAMCKYLVFKGPPTAAVFCKYCAFTGTQTLFVWKKIFHYHQPTNFSKIFFHTPGNNEVFLQCVFVCASLGCLDPKIFFHTPGNNKFVLQCVFACDWSSGGHGKHFFPHSLQQCCFLSK